MSTWKIREHNWSDTGIYDANEKPICLLTISDCEEEDQQERRAAEMANDARLIAAAPEMLTLLRDILAADDAALLELLKLEIGTPDPATTALTERIRTLLTSLETK